MKRKADPSARILSRWQITGSTSSIAGKLRKIVLERCTTDLARKVIANEMDRQYERCREANRVGLLHRYQNLAIDNAELNRIGSNCERER